MDEVRCSGSESRLANCRSNVIGSHDCGHSEDAGVRCGGKSNLYSINFVTVALYNIIMMYVHVCTTLAYTVIPEINAVFFLKCELCESS